MPGVALHETAMISLRKLGMMAEMFLGELRKAFRRGAPFAMCPPFDAQKRLSIGSANNRGGTASLVAEATIGGAYDEAFGRAGEF